MVAKKVYAFECPADQSKDLAWTYKVFQEQSLFTDVQLICAQGVKISAHGAVLLRHCPQLRMIAAKFACCYCHGTDCGGCERNGNLMTVSLPDFSKETILSFLELIYTGRTFFVSNEAYEKVVDLGKHLGFAVPASGLSLVHGEEEETRPLALSSSAKINKKKRSKSILSNEPEISVAPLRKRSRHSEPIPEPNVSELSFDEPQFSCDNCEETFSSKYLLRKHAKNCVPLSTEENNDVVTPAEPATAATGMAVKKKKCQHCQEFFPVPGGWHTKHVKSCLGAPSNNVSNDSALEDVEDEVPRLEVIFKANPERRNSEGLKKECPRCSKSFASNGGWLTKHLARCQATISIENITSPTNEEEVAQEDPGLSQQQPSNNMTTNCPKCPKCGKIYSPHVRRFLKDHITACNGDMTTKKDEVAETQEPPEALSNLKEFVAMYQRGEWNCFACPKWYGRRDVLRQHLLTHYRAEIRADYIKPEGSQKDCSICHFEARDQKSLLQHIALMVHQKLRDYLPAPVQELIFPKKALEETTKPEKETIWICCVCKTKFNEQPQLANHIVDHFNAKILDKYVESGTKCKICKYHDANLNQMTRHVALQHEKIREFIPAHEGDALFPTPKEEAILSDTLEEAVAPQLDIVLDKPKFQCFVCDKPSRSRSDLRQHLFSHYKNEIQAKYYPNANEPIKLCRECPYKSAIPEHVLMHLALKHQKISEFVPEETASILYKDRVTPTKPVDVSTPKVAPKPVNCVRCKATIPGKDELRKHLESCNWKCSGCGIQLRDPKSIKQHRFKCVSSAVANDSPGPSPGRPTPSPSEALTCRLCQRECKHFHYLKGHMSMHFREELRNKVSDWGGGLGGTGYACRLCDFVTSTRDSLVTHAGYGHALFVGFMQPELRKEFYEFAAQAGEKTELWEDCSNGGGPNYACPKCKVAFDSQLHLASHMTNMNCTPMVTVRCVLCDIEVGSALQYKCHLLVHYQSNIESEVSASFKENEGLCKECGEEGRRPMDFHEFVRHVALDHDRLTSIVSPEVRAHMNVSFPDAMALTRSDDKENSKSESFHEEIHIEIEPVDDGVKDDEDDETSAPAIDQRLQESDKKGLNHDNASSRDEDMAIN